MFSLFFLDEGGFLFLIPITTLKRGKEGCFKLAPAGPSSSLLRILAGRTPATPQALTPLSGLRSGSRTWPSLARFLEFWTVRVEGS